MCTARGETFQKTVKHVEIHINKKMWPCFKTAHRHSHEDQSDCTQPLRRLASQGLRSAGQRSWARDLARGSYSFPLLVCCCSCFRIYYKCCCCCFILRMRSRTPLYIFTQFTYVHVHVITVSCFSQIRFFFIFVSTSKIGQFLAKKMGQFWL